VLRMRAETPADGAKDSAAFSAENWDMSKEEFEDVLSEHRESIPVDVTVETARHVAAKLLLHLKLASMPGHTDAERSALEERSHVITRKYIGELAATMHTRLEEEGRRIRSEYETIASGREAMLTRLGALENLEPNHRKILEEIIGHFCVLEEGEKGKSLLGRWINRDAINGTLWRQDVEAWQRIRNVAPPEKPEGKLIADVGRQLQALRRLDPQNLTFDSSVPSLSPGGKFVATLLLGGIALFSLLMARKSGTMSKKGLVAIGLLLYLYRNPESKLQFLSTPEYERLTKNLRGSPEGQQVIDALGSRGNAPALKDYAKREKLRRTLAPGARGDLPSVEQSREELISDLGLKGDVAGKLRAKSPEDILALSTALQKFSPSELDIAQNFAKEDVTRADTGKAKIEEDKPK